MAGQTMFGIRLIKRQVWDVLVGKPTLQPYKEQTALAFLGDLGVTTSLFPKEKCPLIQVDCAAPPPGISQN